MLNIADRVREGYLSPYVDDLKQMIRKETDFRLLYTVFWNKQKLLVNVNRKAPASVIEYCYVYCKNKDLVKWYPDRVRTPYAESSKKRMQKPIMHRFVRDPNHPTTEYKEWKENPLGAYPKNLLNISSESERVSDSHVSVYPVDLPLWFIKAHTDEGDLVLDPFSGTGSTMVASARSNRKGIGIEINEQFFNDSIKRLEKECRVERLM